MPELPEVETIKNGLSLILKDCPQILKIHFFRKNLREVMPIEMDQIFCNQKILEIKRRAKYLIIKCETHSIVSHLGMTGSWRVLEKKESHDHIQIDLINEKKLVYRDPRRFGIFDYFKNEDETNYFRFTHLGIEPFDKKFSAQYLFDILKKSNSPVKSVIMNQNNVVGVGNIYAVESLFKSGIRPQRKADKVTLKEVAYLRRNIIAILKKAIQSGGSTISDFRQAGGSSGYFQHQFKVYGKEGLPCPQCTRILKNIAINKRASVYCPHCQK